MEFNEALKEYNAHAKTRISYEYIAKGLKNIKSGKPLSKQGLWELTQHGGKSGLLVYKEQLERILPKELFEKIDFPKLKRYRLEKREYIKTEKVMFSDEEREEIINYPYIVGKKLRRKIFDNVLVSKRIHDSTIEKLKEEKRRCNVLQSNSV